MEDVMKKREFQKKATAEIEEYDEMRRIKDYGADDENDCLDNIF